MGQTWTHSSLSHGMFSTTPPATKTSIKDSDTEQMFGPVTRAAGSQHVQASVQTYVKMCRGHTQQNYLLHNLSFIALANLQTKYR